MQSDTILEAEYALIGCALLDNEIIKELTVKSKHFYNQQAGLLFNAIKKLDEQGYSVDVVTVRTEYPDIADKKSLGNIINSVPSTEAFKTYEKEIIDAWKLRQVRDIQNKHINDVSAISNIMNDLSELEQENAEEEYDHEQALVELYDNITSQQEGMSGIDTGFKDLNRMLDGFQKGELIVSAARPSVGKSAKMINHAINHGLNGGVVAIFSLEMGQDLLNKRMLSALKHIDGQKMKHPNRYFDDDDWSKFSEAMGVLSKMNIHIYDQSAQTVEYIRSKCKMLRRKYPGQDLLILIDYLQLMRTTESYENKNVEVGEITRGAKELARDTNSPVVLLSQLSRGVEQRQDKRPMLSDLRDSGNVEQDADVIEFLYRDDYYDHSDSQNTIEVIIAKHRNGAVGTVELAYLKEYSLFADLAHDY